MAGFIRQMGLIAECYVFPTLLASVGDMVEHKSGFRPKGLLSTAIIALMFGLVNLPFGGMYETILLSKGFDATLAVQSHNVRNWVSIAFYGFDIMYSFSWIIILQFLDIEKKLPQVNAELKERKKQAVMERGEEWIDPDVLERQERERSELEYEESRIADLKAKCSQKGLDFETENNKYLTKKAKKKNKKKR